MAGYTACILLFIIFTSVVAHEDHDHDNGHSEESITAIPGNTTTGVLLQQAVLTQQATFKSPLTTHVLNIATGRPADNLRVILHRISYGLETLLKHACTDSDGRVSDLLRPDQFTTGVYRLRFETSRYFMQKNITGFYPYVEVVFMITDATEHYHVPLLLSPYGYTTYRGS